MRFHTLPFFLQTHFLHIVLLYLSIINPNCKKRFNNCFDGIYHLRDRKVSYKYI